MQSSRALLVCAHPDDESMFFAPCLQHLVQRGVDIQLLCLSNGNDAGLGEVREQELLAAAALFKIPSSNVTIVHDTKLQDGMDVAWVPAVVAHHVQKRLLEAPCDTVLTFDAYGVSGHANHRGTSEGVRQLLRAKGRSLGVQSAWLLVSECVLVKYSGFLARRWVQRLQQRGELVVAEGRVLTSLRAMAAHSSQWVWYRKLFVLLSSYTFVNRLRPLAVQ